MITSLTDPFIDGNFLEGIIRVFTNSAHMDLLIVALLIWASLGISFYIYSDGIILPLVISIIFGGVISIAMPSMVGSVIVLAVMIGIPSFTVALLWRIYL